MTVKKILFIAPHSFPIHSSESIVNSKLAYTLCDAGYELDVYSAQEDGYSYPCSSEENLLASSNNLNLNIIKIAYLSKDNRFIKNLKLGIEHLLGFIKTGYIYIGSNWGYKAIKSIEKNIKKNGSYDVMITRGYRTEIVALYLNKKYGIKWIANWNDPYPEIKFPSPYGKGFDTKLPLLQERLLRDIQKLALYHTFPSERLRDYMLLYLNNVNVVQTKVIPHMAHSLFLPKKISKQKNTKMRLIHAGDVSFPRNPTNFLCALKNLLSDPSTKNKFECVFIGKQTEDFSSKLIEFNLTQCVQVLPSKSYFEILKEFKNSDASLIIEAICEEGIYLPTKVVDSIQCLLPLFCISPAIGTLNDLIKKNRIGYFSDNSSIDDITSKLKIMINDWEIDNLPVINLDLFLTFFEKNILLDYENIFNEL